METIGRNIYKKSKTVVGLNRELGEELFERCRGR